MFLQLGQLTFAAIPPTKILLGMIVPNLGGWPLNDAELGVVTGDTSPDDFWRKTKLLL